MGIRFRVLAIVIVTLGVGMGLTTIFATKMVINILLKSKEDQSNLLVEAIAQNVQNVMITGNADLAEGLLADQAKLKGVRDLQIITRTGLKPFYDNQTMEFVERKTGTHKFNHRQPNLPMEILSANDPRLLKVLETGGKTGYYEKVGQEELYTQLIPLLNEPRCHACHGIENKVQGVLRVSIAVQEAAMYGQRLHWWLFSLSWTIIGSLSFLLYFLLKKTIINPLTVMSRNMTEIAQGNLNKQIEITSRDEMGNMAKNFNQMAQNLGSNLRELKKINRELEESESRYRLLFNSVKEGIYQAEPDTDGKIILLNQAGAEIFGYNSPQDMIGKKFSECFLEKEDYQMLLGQLQYHGSAVNYVAQGRKMAGEVFFLESTNHMVLDNTTGTLRIQGIFRDITKRKETEQKIIEHEKANALNKISSLFAHDLQNPVVGIKKTIELLRKQDHNMESLMRLRVYEDLQANCELLLGMINEMLDIFHHNYEKLPLRLTGFSLHSAILEAVRLLKIEAEQKNVDLQCSCQPADLRITADQRRLQRVLVNLLSNAIKYTPPGKRVWLSATQNPDTSEIIIKVEDEGSGIAESDLGKVFNQFCHIESEGSRPGTGLGLYFCKTVVQEHGGRIWAENRSQGGARFCIVLPNSD